ncbi:tetratricopeptide repeat protein [Pyxidicoccus sp. 3LG]
MRHGLAMGALLALLTTSQLACVVGPRFTKCPGEGGRPWLRLDSDHYTLQTDLPPEQAREAMRHLERTRVAMLAAMWPDVLSRPMPKLQVYVLRDAGEFEGLYPRRVRAFFFKMGSEALIVLPGAPDSWARRFSGRSKASSSRLNHELAHHLSTYALSRQPRWLSEGLAEYLETLRLSEDGATAVIGGPHFEALHEMSWRLRWVEAKLDESTKVRRRQTWKMDRLFTWDRSLEEALDEDERDRLAAAMYAGSWMLVHWLYNVRPREFAEYQALLAEGVAPDEAQRRALPELETLPLDAVLLEYLRQRTFPEHTVKVPPVSTSYVEQVLEDAEVHAIRAKLAALAANMAPREPFIQNRKKLMKDELDEALRLDPRSLLALTTKLRNAPEAERPAIGRAAVEAHPDESEAWLLLASALGTAPAEVAEREAAYKKALELEPRNAYAATGLAWLLVTQGQPADALPLARWAVALTPWSTYALDTYAMALAGSGSCEEAIQTEQRALELIQDEGNPEMEKVLGERLAGLTDGTLCPVAAPAR